MAATRDSESESSEDDDTEELRRCREAAVPAWGWGPRPEGGQGLPAEHGRPSCRPSLRRRADEHEQDGNALRSSPGFRLHVADRLGALLDSSITILDPSPGPAQAPTQAALEEDDGFRLFFTSIPGSPKNAAPPARSRKRPLPSSSDSDSDEQWRRCQEAAVSATDILQSGAMPAQETSTEQLKPKKKKKKKGQPQVVQGKEAGPKGTPEEQPQPLSLHRDPKVREAQHNGDHVPLTTKRKKRKKKNRTEERGPLLLSVQKGQAASAIK